MMTRYNLFFTLVVLFISISFAQTERGLSRVAAEWTLVDTMENSYGPASSLITPIAYDFGSNALILVHRGSDTYAQSSGEIWYNLSTDLGAAWSRISAINTSLSGNGRYPCAAILNPAHGGLNETAGVFAWMDISNPAGYGIDDPLGNGSPQAAIDSVFSYSIIPWTDNQWAFWAGGTSSDYSIARTTDFVTIEHYQVLNDPVAIIPIGGTGRYGVEYLGFIGKFPDPDPGNPIYSGFYPAYCKSTDYGQTWSEPQVVDFRTIPSLNNFDRLFDYIKNDQVVSYTGDINVDINGRVHFILTVTDTADNNNTGVNAVIEIYEAVNGWRGSVIYDGIGDDAYTTHEGPAIGQMGPCSYLAFDKDRQQMACAWVSDSPASPEGLCDIYIAWRDLNSTHWSQPENLTQTDNMNENGMHLAPVLYSESNSDFKAFVGYFYELGYYGPDPNIINKTGFWVTAVDHSPTGIKNGSSEVRDFYLYQNYPNPFNPSTTLSFVIGYSSFVTLKVYDVLGNEVATLVNEEKPAGSYTVKFDGIELSSGIYFYQLNAGSYKATKKIILLK